MPFFQTQKKKKNFDHKLKICIIFSMEETSQGGVLEFVKFFTVVSLFFAMMANA